MEAERIIDSDRTAARPAAARVHRCNRAAFKGRAIGGEHTTVVHEHTAALWAHMTNVGAGRAALSTGQVFWLGTHPRVAAAIDESDRVEVEGGAMGHLKVA